MGVAMTTTLCKRVIDVPLVPDDVLCSAYKELVKDHFDRTGEKIGRDEVTAFTEHVEEVKRRCGPQYSHVRTDWYRKRIKTCTKNPRGHGGDGAWNVWGGKGASKIDEVGVPTQLSQELLDHYKSAEYQNISVRKINSVDGRCCVCGGKAVECHHHRYDGIKTPAEYDHITPVCRDCHRICDKLRRKQAGKKSVVG